ncbi:MAG: dihydroorotase family protein, partial [Chloroflexota bacterium]|nr:dihydroorotase family protein [Chloroflexota bacterium]
AADSPWSGLPAAASPYHPATRVDPPLRSPADALLLADALSVGHVQALTSGHSPRGPEDADLPYGEVPPGVSTIETCLPLALAAVDAGVVPLLVAARALTSAPAEIAQLREGQPLSEGMTADLVLVDRQREWKIDRRSLHSHGRNTPLFASVLRGQVLLTIAEGRVAWLEEENA